MQFDPFSGKGTWYKGNLHTHSTVSKGLLSPEELKNIYRQLGYAFVAFTDHATYAYHADLSEPDFLVWPGAEPKTVSLPDPPGRGFYPHYHYLALRDEDAVWNNCPAPHYADGAEVPRLEVPPSALCAASQKRIDELRAAGNLVTLNHPVWSRMYLDDLLAMQGYFAIEIYNTHSAVEGHDRGEAALLWDMLLRNGRRIFAIATDDCHCKDKSRQPPCPLSPDDPKYDIGGGFVCVKAEALTVDALARAMKAGRFYASSGPAIKRFYIEEDTVFVECTPVQKIDFITYERRGNAVCASADTLTGASYKLHGDETYVRVQCTTVDGKRAWSNPIFLDTVQ